MSFFRGSLEDFKKSIGPSVEVRQEIFDEVSHELAHVCFKPLKKIIVVNNSKFRMSIYPKFTKYGEFGQGSFQYKNKITQKHKYRNLIEKYVGDISHFCGGPFATIEEAIIHYEKFINEVLNQDSP
jgi:hypothetical protein